MATVSSKDVQAEEAKWLEEIKAGNTNRLLNEVNSTGFSIIKQFTELTEKSRTTFIPQCKGTDSDSIGDLSAHMTKNGPWLWSVKYDGQYVQIHVTDLGVTFYTSSGKPYKNSILENELMECIKPSMRPLILEGEYLGTGEGKHGGRTEAAVVTTLRTATAKGQTLAMEHNIRVFDVINSDKFCDRLKVLELLKNNKFVKAVEYAEVSSLDELQQIANQHFADGMEGLFIKSVNHVQVNGKRVKTALKFKQKNVVTATVVGINEGTGKYAGMTGALVCEDENGLQFTVGSGLTDELRSPEVCWIGKVVEVKYESFDASYVMPTLKAVLN